MQERDANEVEPFAKPIPDPPPNPIPDPPPQPNPVPPGKYLLTLAGFSCYSIRSASNDTLYIGGAAMTDTMQPASQATSIAEVSGSTQYNLNMDISVFQVPSGGNLRFCHILMNYGEPFGAPDTGNIAVASEAMRKLNGPFEQPLNLEQVWGEISPWERPASITSFCDGVVAASSFIIPGVQLEQATQWADSVAVFETDERGYDSADGCGGNSHYSVKWYIRRAGPRPDLAGKRVKGENDPKVYMIDDSGYRHWIPDETTYNNLFRDWSGIKVLDNVNVVFQGPDLTSGAYLAKSPTQPQVYLISNDEKSWITSPVAMDKFHFSWSTIRIVPDADLNAIPNGANIS